jgi:hypothetical protein
VASCDAKSTYQITTLLSQKWLGSFLVGAIFTNLENQSIIIKMTSIPFHSGSWVMKSMETLSHGSLGIGRGLYNPYSFLDMDLVLWHLT